MRLPTSTPLLFIGLHLNVFCRRSFFVAAAANSTLSQKMEAHGVVKDVVDEAPADTMQVKYPSGAVVSMGDELTPTQVKDIPSVNYAADASKFYSLCMTDPDAPSRADPKFGEWLHWLVVNVPGANVNAGDVIDEYVGAGPPKGSGLHRYVLLAYEQPGKIVSDEQKHSKNSSKNRNNFKIRDFAKKYSLGQPVSANFFQAQWDDYVPKLYEQFTD